MSYSNRFPLQTYEQVFMVGGSKNIHDPDHASFMDSLSFLRGWPVREFEDEANENKMKFSYFK